MELPSLFRFAQAKNLSFYFTEAFSWVEDNDAWRGNQYWVEKRAWRLLTSIIGAYDVYIYAHSIQVAVYSAALAEKMGLTSRERFLIFQAALIHDIGKLRISRKIVNKVGKLAAEEYAIIQQHPAIAADMLHPFPGVRQLAPLIRAHHERWDGGGYPQRLSGTQIPLGARLIAVADAVEAMCSDRVYQQARSLNQVRAELHHCSGTQFDPEIVNAFLDLSDEKGETFFPNLVLKYKQARVSW